MILFAGGVSIVFGVTARETPREKLLYGLKVFGEFVGIGLALALVFYFIPW